MKFLPLLLLPVLPCVAEVRTQQPAVQTVDLMAMNQDARCRQVLVTCLVNGAPMRMMLDTGATHTVLHAESAARVPRAHWIDTTHMRFRGNSSQHPRLLMAALQAGPAKLERHTFMVMNLGAVRSMMAEPIDGIIGMDLLGQVPFTFDLARNELYWGVPTGRELVPLYAEPDGTGRVVVQARCGGKVAALLLDTGSSVTRIASEQWAPGAGATVGAQMGNVDLSRHMQMVKGKPGDLELAPVWCCPALCLFYARPPGIPCSAWMPCRASPWCTCPLRTAPMASSSWPNRLTVTIEAWRLNVPCPPDGRPRIF